VQTPVRHDSNRIAATKCWCGRERPFEFRGGGVLVKMCVRSDDAEHQIVHTQLEVLRCGRKCSKSKLPKRCWTAEASPSYFGTVEVGLGIVRFPPRTGTTGRA